MVQFIPKLLVITAIALVMFPNLRTVLAKLLFVKIKNW